MRIISGTAKGTKLYTLEGETTRPTLDRVKESIFNIIQNDIKDSVFLDLFSGSGAIGLEAASRGAKKVILCDKSKLAINIIKKNIKKTHLEEKVLFYNDDFKKVLKKMTTEKFDIIYLDPPYKTNFVQESIELILNLDLIHETSILIVEIDDKKIVEEIKKQKIQIIDERKYGRAIILILSMT